MSETFAEGRTQSCVPDIKNPPLKEGGTGSKGNLVEFQYQVFDQFGAPFGVPFNAANRERLVAAEEGHVGFVTERVEPFWFVGAHINRRPPIDEMGKFVDVVGHCIEKDYPPGFRVIGDRCQFVAGLRLGREVVSYTGLDAAITRSNAAGCPGLEP